MDLLTDWFNQLLETNESIKKTRVDMVPSLAVPTPVVELIFLKCSLFDLPDEVRFLSVELFDRFMRIHFTELVDKVWNKEIHLANDQWKRVEKKLYSQTSLRMLSCIQLASKFIIHPSILRPKEIQKYLNAEGKTFTLAMILASEMRVWRTLKFHLNIPTVLTHVNLILEQLKPLCSFPSHEIHYRAILLTDVVYLHHQEIYRKLFYLSTGRWEATAKEKEEFLPIECNVLYRASAVVALSISFTSRELEETIFGQLSFLTHLPSEDIQALASTINQIVIS